MAEYPSFTGKDLSDFSGRPEASYTAQGTFIATALKQATLLFKIGTCLVTLPDDPINLELAHTAILAMADTAILQRPHQTVMASPFQSESLGSYSYSKMSGAASRGTKTGVMWFDLAVEQLSECDRGGNFAGGGIEVFEGDAQFVPSLTDDDSYRILSPQDEEYHRLFFSGTRGF